MAFLNNTNEDITVRPTNNTINGGDLSLDIDGDLVDLYDNSSNLNFEPFTLTDNKDYFITDKADPDDNF